MSKAKMIGMQKVYIPNAWADRQQAEAWKRRMKTKMARNVQEIATPVCRLVRNDRNDLTGQKDGEKC